MLSAVPYSFLMALGTSCRRFVLCNDQKLGTVLILAVGGKRKKEKIKEAINTYCTARRIYVGVWSTIGMFTSPFAAAAAATGLGRAVSINPSFLARVWPDAQCCVGSN